MYFSVYRTNKQPDSEKKETPWNRHQNLLYAYRLSNLQKRCAKLNSTDTSTNKKPVVMAKLFACKNCSFISKNVQNMMEHMEIHSNSTASKIPTVYKCKQCNYETKIKWDLTRHLMYHGLNKQHEEQEQNPQESVELQCTQCDFTSLDKKSLNKHLQLHKKVNLINNVYQCTKCKYRSKLSWNLKCHEKIHDKPKQPKVVTDNKYKCTLCNFESNSKRIINSHKYIHKTYDERTQVFQCSKCLYKTDNSFLFRKHAMATHKYSKEEFESEFGKQWQKQFRYQCDQCWYATKFKKYIRRHMRIHQSNEATFECPECSFTTKHYNSIKKHMVGIHRSKQRQATEEQNESQN